MSTKYEHALEVAKDVSGRLPHDLALPHVGTDDLERVTHAVGDGLVSLVEVVTPTAVAALDFGRRITSASPKPDHRRRWMAIAIGAAAAAALAAWLINRRKQQDAARVDARDAAPFA